ncbi:hypothetical protein GW17_00020353, partial [Ensete ventricosum]
LATWALLLAPKMIGENLVLAYWMSSASEFCDLELCLGGQLLEWWSSGEEGVLQYGSVADSCKKIGSGRCRSFYNGCCRSFVPDNLTAFMVYHAAVPSTMLIVLAMRRAFVGGGCRPYLCQVGGMTTGTPVHPVGYLRRVGHVDRPTVRGCDDSTAMSTFVI